MNDRVHDGEAMFSILGHKRDRVAHPAATAVSETDHTTELTHILAEVFSTLSPQERRLAAMLTQGLSPAEICSSLELDPKQFCATISQLRTKIKDRVEKKNGVLTQRAKRFLYMLLSR